MKPNKKLSRPSARKGANRKTGKGQSPRAAQPSVAMAPPVLCVTASSPEILSSVFDVLVKAGVAPSVPSSGRRSVDIHSWHAEVLEQLPEDWDEDQMDGNAQMTSTSMVNHAGAGFSVGVASSHASLGRFWDQMASDIFVANFEAQSDKASSRGLATVPSQSWGWADASSIELLSYWASFHPQIRFLLTVSTPHKILVDLLDDCAVRAEAIDSGHEADGIAESESELPDLLDALRTWQWRTERALRFYHRHGQRTQLLWAEEAIKFPQALIERLQLQWGCTLDAAGLSATAIATSKAITATKAITTTTGSVVGGSVNGTADSDTASSTSSAPSDASEVLPALSSLIETAGIQTERNEIVAQVLSMLPEVMSLYHELLATVPMLGDENPDSEVVDGFAGGFAGGVADSGAEGVAETVDTDELLILSLEDDVSLPSTLITRIEEYQARLAQLLRVKQESEAAVKKLKEQLTSEAQIAKAEVEKAAVRVKEAEEENELLLAQLHQVQEELEKYFLKAQDAEKVTAELAQLKKDKDSIAKQLKDAEAKLKEADKKHKEAVSKLERDVKEAKASKDLQARLKDTEEENDLLLAQLHQVQEELERYFLKAQELEQTSEQTQTHWQNLIQRLATRYPGLCDYNSIELIESESNPQAHVWQIEDYIDAAGRELPLLKFNVVTRDGFVGLGFRRNQGNQGNHGNQGNQSNQGNQTHNDARFDLVPGRSTEALQSLAANLDALSTSDWGLIKTLTSLMIEQYQAWVDEALEDEGFEEEGLEKEALEEEGLNLDQYLDPEQNEPANSLEQQPIVDRASQWSSESASSTSGSALSGNFGNAVSNISNGSEMNDVSESNARDVASASSVGGVGNEDSGYSESGQTDGLVVSDLGQDPSVWLAGLEQFSNLLESLPPVLRFDSVTVSSHAEEGEYAHLVLTLSNVVTERGTFPEFEFRLATVSSAAVFDAHPRLEFPRRTGQEVFERWFAESSNAYGENLEIRFAKQDSLVDLPLLTARLKDADRLLVGQLVERLPSIVELIEQQVKEPTEGNIVNDGLGSHDVTAVGGQGRSQASSGQASSIQVSNNHATKNQTNHPVPGNHNVVLMPAVGRLSEADLEQWKSVSSTMRSIWRAQVKF